MLKGGKCFNTKSEDAFFQLTLDADNTVCAAVYCGKMRVSAVRLMSIIGLPSSYFHRLVEKCENGEVADLMMYLHGSWAEALYHDSFLDIRKRLLASAMQSNELNPQDEENIKNIVESKIRGFLNLHHQDLPAYSEVQT